MPLRFQSTSPSREATPGWRSGGAAPRFQSTPPSREATTAACTTAATPKFQSTPPSREATIFNYPRDRDGKHFNPRLPRGRRRFDPTFHRYKLEFQSTPPSREATGHDQFIHRQSAIISIHASLAGGDAVVVYDAWPRTLFQSTPPSREATARYSLILPLEHNIWEFLRICREGCCFSLTFVAEKRRISTCFGANRPGKWAQLPLRTVGDSAHDLLLGR